MVFSSNIQSKIVALVLLLPLLFQSIFAQAETKHRVIILTEMEADPDDTQSLVRLLLYANQIDIKALVATTSCWLQKEVNPESINRVIRAYGQVHANLEKHEKGFPSEQALLNLVKNNCYGGSKVEKEK